MISKEARARLRNLAQNAYDTRNGDIETFLQVNAALQSAAVTYSVPLLDALDAAEARAEKAEAVVQAARDVTRIDEPCTFRVTYTELERALAAYDKVK